MDTNKEMEKFHLMSSILKDEGKLVFSNAIEKLIEMVTFERNRADVFEKMLREDTVSNDEIRLFARFSLAIELSNTLSSRGYWTPKISDKNDNYSDLIGALVMALDSKKDTLNE